MQAAGAGAEGDVGAFRIVRQWLRAVPQAYAAVDAFLAVERWHAVLTGRYGLAARSFALHVDLPPATDAKSAGQADLFGEHGPGYGKSAARSSVSERRNIKIE